MKHLCYSFSLHSGFKFIQLEFGISTETGRAELRSQKMKSITGCQVAKWTPGVLSRWTYFILCHTSRRQQVPKHMAHTKATQTHRPPGRHTDRLVKALWPQGHGHKSMQSGISSEIVKWQMISLLVPGFLDVWCQSLADSWSLEYPGHSIYPHQCYAV